MANSDHSNRREPSVPNETPKKKRKPYPSPKSHVRLTSPEGGEKWPWYSEQLISWEHYSVSSNVDLILLKAKRGLDGVFYEEIGDIAQNLPIDEGSLSWRVGEYISPGIPPPRADSGDDYHILIKTVDGAFSDQNEQRFSIAPTPSLVLTTPKEWWILHNYQTLFIPYSRDEY